MINAPSKQEFRTVLKYTFLSFFSLYLVAPVQEWVNTNLSISPLLIGFVGIVGTLIIFKNR
jgi:hypothetical protein